MNKKEQVELKQWVLEQYIELNGLIEQQDFHKFVRPNGRPGKTSRSFAYSPEISLYEAQRPNNLGIRIDLHAGKKWLDLRPEEKGYMLQASFETKHGDRTDLALLVIRDTYITTNDEGELIAKSSGLALTFQPTLKLRKLREGEGF